MKSVADIDENKLPPTDPTGYFRYALGPLRPAPKEGRGWMFAAGELAMTAEDLAKWDISMINQTVLKPASYREMETEVLLKNGVGSTYGLGVHVSNVEWPSRAGTWRRSFGLHRRQHRDARRQARGGGAHQSGRGRSCRRRSAGQVATLLLKAANPLDPKQDDVMRKIYDGLQQGKIDRSFFTDNANAYFTEQALKDFASSLGPLGAPRRLYPDAIGPARRYDRAHLRR